MNCTEALDRLDDQLEGSLPEASFQELELHLANCPACREEERRLRELLAEAAQMPREIEPPRDLWPGIAERIARQRVLPFAAHSRAWRLLPVGLAAAAAVALALLGTALRAPGPAPTPGRERLADRGSALAPGLLPAAAPAAPTVLGVAEGEYLRAANELTAALAARRPALPPDALRVVDQNLRVIDGALAEIRAALLQDPGNRELSRLLAATHKRKIDMLRRVARLTA